MPTASSAQIIKMTKRVRLIKRILLRIFWVFLRIHSQPNDALKSSAAAIKKSKGLQLTIEVKNIAVSGINRRAIGIRMASVSLLVNILLYLKF